MSEEAPRKRSRFDQTEPEARKTSRFDRRSRSPVARDSESRRSRSPLAKSARSPSTDNKPKTPADPAAAAAAAAARINAQIEARRGIQHVDVPPIKSSSSPAPSSSSAKPVTPSAGNSLNKLDTEIYIADGDYIKDIEVNDLRNRYTLTKGSTQKMVNTPCYSADSTIHLPKAILMFEKLRLKLLIPLARSPPVASTDMHVIDQRRNWRRYADHPNLTVLGKCLCFQDVTTRGSYYPDKSMATAAVSFSFFAGLDTR